jgi:hypothetical protein
MESNGEDEAATGGATGAFDWWRSLPLAPFGCGWLEALDGRWRLGEAEGAACEQQAATDGGLVGGEACVLLGGGVRRTPCGDVHPELIARALQMMVPGIKCLVLEDQSMHIDRLRSLSIEPRSHGAVVEGGGGGTRLGDAEGAACEQQAAACDGRVGEAPAPIEEEDGALWDHEHPVLLLSRLDATHPRVDRAARHASDDPAAGRAGGGEWRHLRLRGGCDSPSSEDEAPEAARVWELYHQNPDEFWNSSSIPDDDRRAVQQADLVWTSRRPSWGFTRSHQEVSIFDASIPSLDRDPPPWGDRIALTLWQLRQAPPPADFDTAVACAMSELAPVDDSRVGVAAAPAVAPDAAPASAAVDTSPVAQLRSAMAGIKGQDQLMAKLEAMVKAAPNQVARDAAQWVAARAGRVEPPKPRNCNMVFLGPSGTFKTTAAKAIGPILHKLGVLKKPVVVVVDKQNPLPKGENIEARFRAAFEKADGGVLFIDEIHQYTKSEYVQPLLSLTEDGHDGRVMTVIAGYTDNVIHWLKTSDPGMSSRFPKPRRVEFKKLRPDTLLEFGVDLLQKLGFTLAESAQKAMRACVQVVHDAEPSENARGMKTYVEAMMESTDGRANSNSCITTEDILAACPAARDVDLSAMAVAAPSASASVGEAPSADAPAPVSGTGEKGESELPTDPYEARRFLPRPFNYTNKYCDDALRRLRARMPTAASNAAASSTDMTDSSRKRQADEAVEGAASKRPERLSSVAADAQPARAGSSRKRPSAPSAVANPSAATGAADGSDSDEPLSSRQRKNAAAGSSSSVAVGALQPPQPTVAPPPPPVAPPQPPAAQPSPLQQALRILYPSAEAALGKFRLGICNQLSASPDAIVRAGWESLGDETVQAQLLNAKRGNKQAHQILDDAFQEMYGLVFAPIPPAGHGKQGGNRLVRSMPAADA